MSMDLSTRKTVSSQSMREESRSDRPVRRSLFRRLLRWGGFAFIFLAAIIFGGFLHFADSITTLKPPLEPKADAIVVLTGGY